MEAFEIFQIAVKEGVLVVPFDFQSEGAAFKFFNVINLVRDGFAQFTIHDFIDLEAMLLPASL